MPDRQDLVVEHRPIILPVLEKPVGMSDMILKSSIFSELPASLYTVAGRAAKPQCRQLPASASACSSTATAPPPEDKYGSLLPQLLIPSIVNAIDLGSLSLPLYSRRNGSFLARQAGRYPERPVCWFKSRALRCGRCTSPRFCQSGAASLLPHSLKHEPNHL